MSVIAQVIPTGIVQPGFQQFSEQIPSAGVHSSRKKTRSKALARAVWASTLPSALKPLASWLAAIGFDDGTFAHCPTVAEMAEQRRMCHRTAKYQFKRLEALGYIVVTAPACGRRGRRFWLDAAALAPAAGASVEGQFQPVEGQFPERLRRSEASTSSTYPVAGAPAVSSAEAAEPCRLPRLFAEVACVHVTATPAPDPAPEPQPDPAQLPLLPMLRKMMHLTIDKQPGITDEDLVSATVANWAAHRLAPVAIEIIREQVAHVRRSHDVLFDLHREQRQREVSREEWRAWRRSQRRTCTRSRKPAYRPPIFGAPLAADRPDLAHLATWKRYEVLQAETSGDVEQLAAVRRLYRLDATDQDPGAGTLMPDVEKLGDHVGHQVIDTTSSGSSEDAPPRISNAPVSADHVHDLVDDLRRKLTPWRMQ